MTTETTPARVEGTLHPVLAAACPCRQCRYDWDSPGGDTVCPHRIKLGQPCAGRAAWEKLCGWAQDMHDLAVMVDRHDRTAGPPFVNASDMVNYAIRVHDDFEDQANNSISS